MSGLSKYIGPRAVDFIPPQPIFDYTVAGAAVTSVTTNGILNLDGIAHGGYRFEFLINIPAGGNVDYRLYANNDTTGTDYYFWYYYFGVTAANVTPVNDAYISFQIGANARSFISGDIVISSDGMVVLTGTNLHTSNYTQLIGWRKIAVVPNLTRLDVVAGTALKIGIGSRFRLWQKK